MWEGKDGRGGNNKRIKTGHEQAERQEWREAVGLIRVPGSGLVVIIVSRTC